MYHVSVVICDYLCFIIIKVWEVKHANYKDKKKLILIDKYFISYALKSNELSPENKTNI